MHVLGKKKLSQVENDKRTQYPSFLPSYLLNVKYVYPSYIQNTNFGNKRKNE